MLVFTTNTSYLGACVCRWETDRLTEADGCVWVQWKMNRSTGSGRVRLGFSVPFKVCAEHSVLEVVAVHSRRECSCVGRQWGGGKPVLWKHWAWGVLSLSSPGAIPQHLEHLELRTHFHVRLNLCWFSVVVLAWSVCRLVCYQLQVNIPEWINPRRSVIMGHNVLLACILQHFIWVNKWLLLVRRWANLSLFCLMECHYSSPRMWYFCKCTDHCGNRSSELLLLIFLANGAPCPPFSVPLSTTLFLPHTGCQAALTMNQSLGGFFDCRWAEEVTWMHGFCSLSASPCALNN